MLLKHIHSRRCFKRLASRCRPFPGTVQNKQRASIVHGSSRAAIVGGRDDDARQAATCIWALGIGC